MSKVIMTDPLHDSNSAATFLDVKRQTLDAWRSQNKGPAFIKIGKNVRYRQSSLDAFLERNTVTPGSSQQ